MKKKLFYLVVCCLMIGIISIPLMKTLALNIEYDFSIGEDTQAYSQNYTTNSSLLHQLVMEAYDFNGYSSPKVFVNLQTKVLWWYSNTMDTHLYEMSQTYLPYMHTFGQKDGGTYRYRISTLDSEAGDGEHGFNGFISIFAI